MSDARAAISLAVDAGKAADPAEAAWWLIDRQLVLDEAGRGASMSIRPPTGPPTR
jgi:hypothetical protein